MIKTFIAALVAITIGGAAWAVAPVCQGECMVHRDNASTFTERWNEPAKIFRVQNTVAAPATVVKGGDWAANILAWFQTAFVGIAGVALTALGYRALGWLGVQVTDQQKAQLQGIIVNGLNAAGDKAQTQLRNNPGLDINVKSQIIADAVSYTQSHAADTIKALGLDPNSGQAVEAIKARIQTALNDPATPTPPLITPVTGGGTVNAQPLAPKNA